MRKSRILGAAGLVAALALGGYAAANDARKASAGEQGCPGLAAKAAASPHARGGDSAAAKFAAIDTDGDGALSRAEVEGRLPGIAQHFDALDADGDGRLTSYELHHGGGHAGHHGRPVRQAGFETRTISL